MRETGPSGRPRSFHDAAQPLLHLQYGRYQPRLIQRMPDIEISKQYSMPRDKLRSELESLVGTLAEQLQLECEWLSEDCLDFRRKGAEGQININDDEIEMTIRLGLLLSAFSGVIEQEVQEFFEEHIY